MTGRRFSLEEKARVNRQVLGIFSDLAFTQDNLRRMKAQFPQVLLKDDDVRTALFAVRIHLEDAKRWALLFKSFVEKRANQVAGKEVNHDSK